NGLRTEFRAGGVWIEPRDVCAGGEAWGWGLSFGGLSRGSPGQSVTGVEPVPNGNRVEYERPGIVEWYINGERGLEQGFTITAPPISGDPGEPLRVEMTITGSLTGTLSSNGQRIDFRTPDGDPVLVYDHLAVFDDQERILPARLALEGSTLSIVVDDRGAAYPITIDPLASSPSWVAENVGEFGTSVSTAGDVNGDGYDDILASAPRFDGGEFHEGRVFLYMGSAAGPEEDPSWTFEPNQVQAGLSAVANAGDVNGDGYSDIAVGAPGYDDGGRVWVFHGRANGPGAGATWATEHLQEGAAYGVAVAGAGDVNGDGYGDLLISAPLHDSGGVEDAGRVFVFHGSEDGLADITPEWTYSGDALNSDMGRSAAHAGDVNGDGYADVIIGAPRAREDPDERFGRAFVFHGSASGLGVNPAWTAQSSQDNSAFGEAVSTAGDTNGDGYSEVIVGAQWYDAGQQEEGRAFIYMGGSRGLAASPAWTTESNQADAQYGSSVAFAGDVDGDGYGDVAVGARYFSENGFNANGKVWVFHGSADGTSDSSGWRESGNRDGGVFGNGLSTAGDVNGDGYADLLIGQSGIGGNVDPAQVYVYLGGPDAIEAAPSWNVFSDQSQAQLGYSVAPAGDVNGDGYADMIVGAPFFDNGQADEGLAAVFHGGPEGPEVFASFFAEGGQAGAQLGTSVAGAGDVNGDGYDDVLAGAPYYDNGQSDEGRVYGFHGGEGGISGPAEWSAEPSQADARLGTSVAGAGDLNGDGFADVVAGAPFFDGEGGAFVYHGADFGLLSPEIILQGGHAGARYGWAVSSAGDVNGDGYSDVAIGAPRWDDGGADVGRVSVHHGSSGGVHAGHDWEIVANQANAYFGQAVAAAGDVNGDGFSDLIAASPRYDGGETDEGRAFVYHGSGAGLSGSNDWNTQANQAQALYGTSVASAGDVNGDGYSDVIVGAYGYDNGETDEGRAWVFHGGDDGLSAASGWRDDPDVADAFFGFSVAGAGDVNGDGFDDVVIGAPREDGGAANDGMVYLYYGGGGPGIVHNPRQRQEDDEPLAHLGMSDDEDRFRIRAIGRGPVGRTRVKMEWEVKPLGEAFDGTGLQRGALWQTSNLLGRELTALATLLSEAEAQHWRVRLLYEPAASPLAQRGRWMSPNGNAWSETDLRTLGMPCPVDLNGDGTVNTQDFIEFLNLWNAGDDTADWNGDGVINTQDFIQYLNDWNAGC
ncbi:MAG TPA: FG-GAP-like repeat-containing protein, partial [Phycisphaerales bacterium]|nr:FG-GAP-like repeat-containing protein [Phycisphaerales bacterium]